MIFDKKIISITFLILISIQIWWFSSIPNTGINTGGFSFIPTAYHFTIYFLLSFFILATLKTFNKKTFKLTIGIALLISILDELHQYFIPGRSPSIEDIIIDLLGILIGAAFYYYIKINSPRPNHS